MSIIFEKPFKFIFEVLEFDEKLPSIKVEVRFELNNFQSDLSYKGYGWIECSVFDRFVSNLDADEDGEYVMGDIDGVFSISVKKIFNDRSVGFIIKRDWLNDSKISVNYESKIDDEFYAIRRSFKDFPCWW